MHFQSHHSDPSTTTVPTHSPSPTSTPSTESPVEYKAKLGALDSSCDSNLSTHPQSSCLPAALQPFLDTILHHTIGHASTGFELDHSPQADPHPTHSRKEAALDAIPRAFEDASPDPSMLELVQQNLFNAAAAAVTTALRGAEVDGAKTGPGITAEPAAGKEQSERQSHRVFDQQHPHQQQSPLSGQHHPHIVYPTTPCPSSATTTARSAAQPSLTGPATPSLSPISVDGHAANSDSKDLYRGTHGDTKGHTKKTNAASSSATPIATDIKNNRRTLTDTRLGPVSSSSSSSVHTCNVSVDAQPSRLLGHLISATSAAPLQKLRGDGYNDCVDGFQENGSTRQAGTAIAARPLTQDKDDAEPCFIPSLKTVPVPEMNKAQIDSQAQLLIRGEESFDDNEDGATDDCDRDRPLSGTNIRAIAGGRKWGEAEEGERKRLSGTLVLDFELSRKKRGKDQDLIHPLQFLTRREKQRRSSGSGKGWSKTVSDDDKRLHLADLPFDPVLFLSTWSHASSLPSAPSASNNDNICEREKGSNAETLRYCSGHSERSRHFQHCYHLYRNKNDRHLYMTSVLTDTPQSRKRVFTEAIAISGPLGKNVKAIDHPDWVESVKRRKVHQYATRWTSRLSPSPYVKLLTVRDFWDLMDDRTDLSWRAEKDMDTDSTSHSAGDRSRRTTRQLIHHPCPTQFLKGLWEEEMMVLRKRQMIPDSVRKPNRSKVFNPKPLVLVRKTIKATGPQLPAFALTSSPLERSNSIVSSEHDTQTNNDNGVKDESSVVTSQVPMELDLALKKKHRAAAIIRSHAITEGSDMAEYKPWKDGTVSPQQGSLKALKELRCHIMEPWPEEISKARDECTTVLHRMREQLNIVINLQIHLRSMIKTAPTHWSFLLSIRHPGQVSIELLLALYGPNFMQTSNFRAIEQLLWGNNKGGNSSPSFSSSPSSSPSADSPLSSSISPSSPESTVDQSTAIV